MACQNACRNPCRYLRLLHFDVFAGAKPLLGHHWLLHRRNREDIHIRTSTGVFLSLGKKLKTLCIPDFPRSNDNWGNLQALFSSFLQQCALCGQGIASEEALLWLLCALVTGLAPAVWYAIVAVRSLRDDLILRFGRRITAPHRKRFPWNWRRPKK